MRCFVIVRLDHAAGIEDGANEGKMFAFAIQYGIGTLSMPSKAIDKHLCVGPELRFVAKQKAQPAR